MYKMSLYVPAKAMLLGEYGVLYGGKAIACTFFEHYFLIHIQAQSTQSKASTQIISSFFKNNFIEFENDEIINSEKTSDINFFKNLLKPWKNHLKSINLSIEIEKSFSPSLGFGSSSALIAGISKSLWKLFFKDISYLNNEIFWNYIRTSLKEIQGNGSGYDIAVQLAASHENILQNNIQFWIFQNQENNSVPIIDRFILKDKIENYGFFLATQMYSDTSKVIKDFQSQAKKEEFALKHTSLANEFIINSNIEHTYKLMELSRKIAQEQGLIPQNNDNLNKIINQLNKLNIPYKTMGAGHGDCLWVLYNKNTFLKHLKIQKLEIPFVFHNLGNSI
ncbi:mevalonate kinase family protein [Fluviispira multicolorata]|uniref:GHMP kinase N-terminal domain-containing protein n=1 Tax=Fluviispira multicolorata TaxID=2654512 RepID=A0A833JDD8_9BACT|nr:hypothetical protein [Fluviispira multicolorata]KAB8031815.1 hypothetical protein GCL57_04010 [Fluviispira multicolorata]